MRSSTEQVSQSETRRLWTIGWTVSVTVIAEVITIMARLTTGISAAEFNRSAPLWMQIHHMFWSVPLFVVLLFCWNRPRVAGTLLGFSFGFILSDLIHHFVVLPIAVGNTGWHWP